MRTPPYDSRNFPAPDVVRSIDMAACESRRDVFELVHRSLLSDRLPGEQWRASAPPGLGTEPEPDVLLSPDWSLLELPLGDVIGRRDSERSFGPEPVTTTQLATVLGGAYRRRSGWPAYDERNVPVFTAPSAGGLHSVELFLVVLRVDGLRPGLYEYLPGSIGLKRHHDGSCRGVLTDVCAVAPWLAHAGFAVLVAWNFERLSWKYGLRAYRLGLVDAGVVAQNLMLVTTAVGLAGCLYGGLVDDDAGRLLAPVPHRDQLVPTLVFGAGSRW